MTKPTAVLLALWLLTSATTAAQAPDLATIGPSVGARAADWSGVDQFGRTQSLQAVMGGDGLMLVFYRSADW